MRSLPHFAISPAVVSRLVAITMAVVFTACGGAPPKTVAKPVVKKPEPKRPSSVASAEFLANYAGTYRFRLGKPRTFSITPDGKEVLFLRSGARSFVNNLYAFDVATGKERVVLTAQAVLKGAAEHLSAAEKARRERMRQTARGIASYRLSKDGKRLVVPLSGRLYVVERSSGGVQELAMPSKGYALDPQLSPTGKHVSYVKNGDLYVFDLGRKKERRLTKHENTDIGHGAAEFVAQEEMRRRHGNWWAPDGKSLVYQRTDNTGVEKLHVYDPAHPERASRGTAYPRPGKKNAVVTLGVVSVKGGKTRWLSWDRGKYPYVVRVVWSKHGPLTVLVQDRRQKSIAVLEADPKTGKTTQLFAENDKEWVNIDAQMPRWMANEDFLWTTERNGAWQLMRHGKDGSLSEVLTKPDFGYRKLAGIDEKRGVAYVVASKDPTVSHVWEVSLDGKKAPKRLSEGAGQHGLKASSSGVQLRFANTLTGGSTVTVVRKDGKAAGVIKSVAEKPRFKAKTEFLVVGKDGYHAQVFRPRNFDPAVRYPVIVYVYGGPHWAVVQKSGARWAMRQWIADHGYIVASFDGRGTPHRGRKWERAISGNFIAAPMADQVAALKALGGKIKQLDLGRVGIFGWSFGGYFSSMAVMRRPDVYKCAVAGAPVADWGDYDTHYTERYIGLPAENKAGYADSSVLTWAPKLTRPLLVVHGTADDNVYFTHAIRMSDALFRAGKHHEFLPLTGFTHMVADPKVLASLYGRILGHFQRCLADADGP